MRGWRQRTMRRAGAVVILCLAAGGCASTNATRTLGTLAGSSAGAAAGQAIGASGIWGYVAAIASTAVGGFAGNQVTRLFGGSTLEAQQTALTAALDGEAATTQVPWGEGGKGPQGFAAATGPVFTGAAGQSCRPFRVATYKGEGVMSGDMLAGLKDAKDAVKQGKGAADNLSDINSVGDAVDGAKDAAKAADSARDAAMALTADASPTPANLPPIASEQFGTACKNAKGKWAIIKA